MKQRWSITRLLAATAGMVIALAVTGVAWAAVSGSSSLTSGSDITDSGTASVQLQLNAESVTTATPTDVFIILDASGSVGTSNFNTAKSFADDVVTALDGAGLFTNGGRIGLIRYADSATLTLALNGDATTVHGALAAMAFTGGFTATGDALNLATAEFNADSPAGTNRIVILLTDGNSNRGASVASAVASSDAAGVERFAVGIGSSIDVSELNLIGSDPDAEHVFSVSDFGALAGILDELVAAVTEPGASDIDVLATVASRFGPPTGAAASKGTATIAGQSVQWQIGALGTEANPTETATLTYDIAVSCEQGPGGVLTLHDAITYSDAQGNVVTFDLLSVNLHGCVTDIDLQPAVADNPTGTDHTVVATVTDDFGDPVAGVTVTFDVTAGPDAGTTGSAVTNAAGEASFTFTGSGVGTDSIVASAGTVVSNTATKEWINEPPTAEANGPYSALEGGSLTLSSAGSSDPEGQTLTIAWDLDDDGVFETPGASPAFPADDGPLTATVTVEVCDPFGLCDTDSATVTIENVPPTADAGSAQTVFRGDPVSLSGTWTDPAAALDEPYEWSWDLDGDGLADDSGTAAYGASIPGSTSFALEGTYTLTFSVTDKDGGTDSATVVITVLNGDPSCDAVAPSISEIWPPNHQLVPVNVLGVTDPEGDPITIVITGISQDEPVSDIADGSSEPDGVISGDTAEVRAERSGSKQNPGNGRVYHIAFTASDGHGGSCSGSVTVGVPHDQRGDGAVDDGPLYDSTVTS